METEVNLIDHKTRDAWLTARNHSIGASESAALFGLAPDGRESEFSLWAKKTGLSEAEQIDAEWLDIGQALEEPIAQLYTKRTGNILWTPPSPFCVAVHPRFPFMTATVDRWIVEAIGRESRGDLEIKNVGAFNSDWHEEIPLYVQCQVQHQLAVTGFQWAEIAALIGGNHVEIIPVERNAEFIAELEAKAVEFWGKVERKEAPPIDGKAATAKALKRMHPSDNGKTIALDQGAANMATLLAEAKGRESREKKLAEELENQLRALLGPNTFGSLPDGRTLSLKTTDRGGYTVQPTSFRTLRIQEPKKTKGGK